MSWQWKFLNVLGQVEEITQDYNRGKSYEAKITEVSEIIREWFTNCMVMEELILCRSFSRYSYVGHPAVHLKLTFNWDNI